MIGDITPPSDHTHRWFFLQTRAEFEEQPDGLYKRTEYAYFVCNNCTADGQPTVIKRKVKNKE